MRYLALILVGLIAFIFFFGIVKSVYDILKAIINYFYRDKINRYLLFRNLKPEYLHILKNSFQYYNQLKVEDKILFEKRVQKFIDMKKFVPRGELKTVTSEMKVLIAASAIQVTFGYPGVYFEHFWRILLFPDNYYSEITDKYHKGEVSMRGFIVLSWNHFLSGYLDPSDGRNLGLHEMAHALRLENAIRNDEYDYIDEDVIIAFDKETKLEVYRMNEGTSTFFRSYAATNEHEFFAVAVENFFERSKEFQKERSYLYYLLTKMLRQDPLLLKDHHLVSPALNVRP